MSKMFANLNFTNYLFLELIRILKSHIWGKFEDTNAEIATTRLKIVNIGKLVVFVRSKTIIVVSFSENHIVVGVFFKDFTS